MSSETANNGGKSESGMTGITDPRDTDVLCGRGGAALRHPGNQTYRRLVNLNKGLYITCLKTEKLKISRSIVAAIREQNGRFLEKDNKEGSWYDIGDKKAIEKTSQALREGQPKLRQKIVEMGGGAAGTVALMEQQFGANGLYAQNAVQHQMQRQAGMGGFDPTNPLAQQMGPGGRMVGGQMAMALMNPQQSMVSAMQQAQMNHQQPYGNPPMGHQPMNMPNYNHPQQQQQRMQAHHDMPPPQARQALHNEMMRLSMHGDDDPQPSHRMSGEPAPLRPSTVKRGSGAMPDPGIQSSNMSLMSNFSGFGDSIHGPTSAQFGLGPSKHNDPYDPFGQYNQQDVDRRNMFAKMKFSRPPSDRMSGRHLGGASAHSMGDGMPDFHMVESQLSLYSNLSGMTGHTGSDSKTKASFDGSAGGSRPSGGDLLGAAGSRHSIMSGLSRISDTSEVHSIFSDLSRKIGNVSTRSIAMSEISGIDQYRGGDDSDSTPSFGEAPPGTNPSGTMDFDVF